MHKMAANLATLSQLMEIALLRIGTTDNDINAACRPGAVIRINGDPRYAVLHAPVFTGRLMGDCRHCGGPLKMARSASCWYCRRPL